MPKKETDRVYKQITCKAETVAKYHEVKERFNPRYSMDGFLLSLLEAYESYHCPECGTKLKSNTCFCQVKF